MTTLRARLFVLVASILVLAAAGAWFVFARLARTDVETFLAGQAVDHARSFVPDLESAYARNNDWRDAEPVLARAAAGTGRVPVVVTAQGDAYTASSPGAGHIRATRLPDGSIRLAVEEVQDGRAQMSVFELHGGAALRASGVEVAQFFLLPRPAAPAAAAPGVRFTSALGRSAALALALAALVALVLATALGRRIVGPIEELTRAVRTFDAGDPDARVAVRGEDEIGTLAGAFNRMAERRSLAERARRALVADVAHELRTPLTNLTAQIEALEDGLAPPDAAALASLHEEVDQLTHLVEDLTELAVADAGGLRLSPRRVVLAEEFAAVRTGLEPRALAAGVVIAVEVAADASGYADARRLRQALRNLVDNAIAHTPAGGRITLSARSGVGAAGPELEIAVADTGEGIPAAHLERVFERFHRVDPSRARATGGRGLGLAIVRQYIEAMGGQIRAESAPGQGTTMLLTLPAEGPPGRPPDGRA